MQFISTVLVGIAAILAMSFIASYATVGLADASNFWPQRNYMVAGVGSFYSL